MKRYGSKIPDAEGKHVTDIGRKARQTSETGGRKAIWVFDGKVNGSRPNDEGMDKGGDHVGPFELQTSTMIEFIKASRLFLLRHQFDQLRSQNVINEQIQEDKVEEGKDDQVEEWSKPWDW